MTCTQKLYVNCDIDIPIEFENTDEDSIDVATIKLISRTGEVKSFLYDKSDKTIKISKTDITVPGKYFIEFDIFDAYAKSRRLTPCPSYLIFEP